MKNGVMEAAGRRSEVSEVRTADLVSLKEAIVAEKFAVHPFLKGVNEQNVRNVLSDYAAMSQLFPYMQAKAIGDVALNSLLIRNQIGKAVDQTAACGAFLVSDEFGVHHLACTEGNAGLPKILDTKDNFHFQMLLKDARRLFGEEVQPNYSPTTMSYMNNLLKLLSSDNDVDRVAAMSAFETHAEQMITALWTRLVEIFPSVDKDSLDYFRIHVGGDDPAEEYHVAMTTKMITEIVPDAEAPRFANAFEDAYRLNYDWCNAITVVSSH